MASYRVELGTTGTLILLAIVLSVFGTIAYFVVRKKKNREKQLEELRAGNAKNPPAFTTGQNLPV